MRYEFPADDFPARAEGIIPFLRSILVGVPSLPEFTVSVLATA